MPLARYRRIRVLMGAVGAPSRQLNAISRTLKRANQAIQSSELGLSSDAKVNPPRLVAEAIPLSRTLPSGDTVESFFDLVSSRHALAWTRTRYASLVGSGNSGPVIPETLAA